MLTFYRQLIDLRREHPALAIGSYHAIEASGDVLAFERRHADGHCVVALNLGQVPVDLVLPGTLAGGRVLLGTHLDREQEATTDRLSLRPDEGLVIGYGGESRSY
jgi:alpha-glucosidase